jgi:hypothetical protein
MGAKGVGTLTVWFEIKLTTGGSSGLKATVKVAAVEPVKPSGSVAVKVKTSLMAMPGG